MRKYLFIGLLASIMVSKATAENLYLGDLGSNITWLYLCGLTDDFYSPQEIENRDILERIGKRQGIKFLALHPFERCPLANNKLCWVHYTQEQAVETFKQISEATKDLRTAGFIGFSNGGYFLNEIAQLCELGVPIISIGAAGTYRAANCLNNLTLVVGKEEFINKDAHNLVKQANGTQLSLKLVEHAGDHILPEQEMEELMENLYPRK